MCSSQQYTKNYKKIHTFKGKEFNNILFDQALPRLQERGVSQYLLEVDISDSKALIYYRHKGFKKERELVNVRVDIAPSSLPRKNASVTTRRMSQPDWQHWQHWCLSPYGGTTPCGAARYGAPCYFATTSVSVTLRRVVGVEFIFLRRRRV